MLSTKIKKGGKISAAFFLILTSSFLNLISLVAGEGTHPNSVQ
jgi:hypothetical protein